ncbi:MAG: hypothetical protein ACD_46C00404G0003, partial [uncultured bacterium]
MWQHKMQPELQCQASPALNQLSAF